MSLLKTLEYTLGNSPTHTVICMHGLGAGADDLHPLAHTFQLPNVRFVFPQAPSIPITINNGYLMPAWYDITSMDFSSTTRSDHTGVDASCAAIKNLIANEQAQYGIKPEHIFLMGFSQGGSIALELGLHYPQRFAGIIGLSTLAAKGEKTFENVSAESQNTPVFLAHGTQDQVLPFSIGSHIQQTLKNKHYSVEWHTAAVGHTIWPEEMTALKQWFQRQFL
ncbi:MAG: alpha/beta hydrolase fold domain-containing protein [Gammaproteobacteria bacterium]|nr:alpha/beta hydrolase fold domain-containing protein [Gammaproteobacteria bacterium]